MNKDTSNIKELINSHNKFYLIKKFYEFKSFKLKSSNLRNYYYQNILAFGDLLHRIHPLAGQGFNMSVRDIKELVSIINFRTNLGLSIDSSVCLDFEKRTKHKNYLFSNSIDFIYEFFNLERKVKTDVLSKAVKFLGNQNSANRFFTKFADNGLVL